MMYNYVLSILGIVIAGVLIDVIVPSGSINKYIKSIYSVFVVAILLNPLIKFLNKNHNFNIKYEQYEINDNLSNYIFKMRATSLETNIEKMLDEKGFKHIDIKINFSIENYEIKYNSCYANIENMVIDEDNLHINKYDYIKEVIKHQTNLTDGDIIINE